MRILPTATVGLLLALLTPAHAKELGSVTTTFNPLTPNDRIAVEKHPDPKVTGVTCYLSRARKGGAASWVGLATDSSDASVACRQTGPITVDIKTLPQQEYIFKNSTSPLFKSMQIVRMLDVETNTLLYLVYSDHLIDGSPKNALTAVPIMPWTN